VGSADEDAVHVDDGVLRMGFAAGEFEALLDAEDVLDLGEGEEGLEGVMGALVADRRDDGLLRADDGAGVVAELLDLGDDFVDLLAGGVGANDDDHERGECSDSPGDCPVLSPPFRFKFLWRRGWRP